MQHFRRFFSELQRINRTMKFIGIISISVCKQHNRCLFSILSRLVLSDIGANLTDGMFNGIYNGSQKHPDDLDIVLQRSWSNGLDKIIVTVGCLNDTEQAAKITENDGMYFDSSSHSMCSPIFNCFSLAPFAYRTIIFYNGMSSNALQ